jgi:hypothetical protein
MMVQSLPDIDFAVKFPCRIFFRKFWDLKIAWEYLLYRDDLLYKED